MSGAAASGGVQRRPDLPQRKPACHRAGFCKVPHAAPRPDWKGLTAEIRAGVRPLAGVRPDLNHTAVRGGQARSAGGRRGDRPRRRPWDQTERTGHDPSDGERVAAPSSEPERHAAAANRPEHPYVTAPRRTADVRWTSSSTWRPQDRCRRAPAGH